MANGQSRDIVINLSFEDLSVLGLDYGFALRACSSLLDDSGRQLSEDDVYKLYLLRGRLYDQLGNSDKAVHDYEELSRRRPTDPDPQWRKARALLVVDHKEAQRNLERLIDQHPQFAPSFFTLGCWLVEKGYNEQGIQLLTRAISLDSSYAEAYFGRAVAYLKVESTDAALADLSKCIALQPLLLSQRPEEVYGLRGAIYLGQGKLDLAMQDFVMAHRINATAPNSWRGIWACFWNRGNHHACIQLEEQHLKIEPRSYAPYLRLGASLSLLGKHDDAIRRMKEARERAPDNDGLRVYLGVVYARKGDYLSALEEWDSVIVKQESHPGALRWKALLLATCPDVRYRDGKKAQQLIGKLGKQESIESRAFLVLAAALAESGRFEEAVAAVEKARQTPVKGGNAELAHDLKQLATCFEARKAYHEFGKLRMIDLPPH